MTDLLSAIEMASLNRALSRRTGGRVRAGPQPISVAQGFSLWNAMAGFCEPALAKLSQSGRSRHMIARPAPIRDNGGFRGALRSGAVLAATASLGACTSLGGNVQGNFSCRAPDGICAPTSTIDDAALALIGGDESLAPVGSYTEPSTGNPRLIRTAAAEPARSGEKVLRIVFPSHIDRAGRFHETAAIHAVVERPTWTTAAAAPAQTARVSAVMLQTPEQSYPDTAVRTLSELAWSAPEVRFPDPVASIDARIAADADATASTGKAALAAVAMPDSRSRVSVSASGAARGGTAAAPGPASGPPVVALSYSLPAQTAGVVPNPIETIRAQVAGRLKPSGARASGPTAAVPSGEASRSDGSGAEPGAANTVSRPSLFPVSGVNP